MDTKTLLEAMSPTGITLARAQELLPALENAMRAAGINNTNRASMYLAQIGHESAGLRYMEEIHDGSNYEWRSDLGNVHAGDGRRYKGRGPIQLTGRSHYRNFTRWARDNGHSTIDFEAEPHRLSEPHWGFLAATYYWTVSRPNLNRYSDNKDIFSASCDINGWIKKADGTWRTPNGYSDRVARWNRCLAMGSRILPSSRATEKSANVTEIRLDYPRDQVAQDTYYNCGPASVQTVVRAATGKFHTELEIGGKLRTHRGGTDYIGQFPSVLNQYIPNGHYRHADVPNYLNAASKGVFWDRIVNSINAERGVIVNIVAPPSNYPKAVSPSTISPAYRGGTVYHYFSVMGYSDQGQRKVWVADSGFEPYGYWLSFEQLCTLVVPKGYAYSTAEAKVQQKKAGTNMTILTGESAAALHETKTNTYEIKEILKEIQSELKAIKSETRITNEQFAGPGRDEHGNLLWTGWDGNEDWGGTEGKATIQKAFEHLEAILKGLDDDRTTKENK